MCKELPAGTGDSTLALVVKHLNYYPGSDFIIFFNMTLGTAHGPSRALTLISELNGEICCSTRRNAGLRILVCPDQQEFACPEFHFISYNVGTIVKDAFEKAVTT